MLVLLSVPLKSQMQMLACVSVGALMIWICVKASYSLLAIISLFGAWGKLKEDCVYSNSQDSSCAMDTMDGAASYHKIDDTLCPYSAMWASHSYALHFCYNQVSGAR